jgi:hypothetical protein
MPGFYLLRKDSLYLFSTRRQMALSSDGLSLPKGSRIILITTTIHISGLGDARKPVADPDLSGHSCLLQLRISVIPSTRDTWSSLLPCWLDFKQVGLEPDMINSHPLNNNIEFSPFIDSHRSGFNLTR